MSTSTADDFDILDWIETGTVAQRTVVIYNDPAVIAEFEELERRLASAEKAAKNGTVEQGVGDRDERATITSQMEALYARWQASKSTWTVQALAPEVVKAIADEFPAPVRPDLPKGMAETLRAKRYEEFTAKQAEVVDERNLRYISAAVVSVETPKGVARKVSVDALRAMKAKPHGPARVNMLLKAVEDATNGDVEIPAPNSLSSSKGTQG